MYILSILVLRISKLHLFSVILILALMLPSVVSLHEFAPKTLQIMSVCGYLKFIYCGKIFFMMHQSCMFLDLYVDSILPFCFWVILWKECSMSQICVTWQHDSPIQVTYKFWNAITLIEGCELKIMESWTYQLHTFHP